MAGPFGLGNDCWASTLARNSPAGNSIVLLIHAMRGMNDGSMLEAGPKFDRARAVHWMLTNWQLAFLSG